MRLITFPALILQQYETGNSSGMVRTFSGAFGRLAVMARGGRDPRKGLGATLQPLALVELTVAMREGADTATLREASVIDSHSALHADLERLALASLIVEIASESCDTAQESQGLFRLACEALQTLAPGSAHPAPFAALLSLERILAEAGYAPSLDHALLSPWPKSTPRPRVFWLDVSEGRVHLDGHQPAKSPEWPTEVPEAARHYPVPPSVVRLFHESSQGDQSGFEGITPVASDEAEQGLGALVRLARWHVGHALRSERFWRSLH